MGTVPSSLAAVALRYRSMKNPKRASAATSAAARIAIAAFAPVDIPVLEFDEAPDPDLSVLRELAADVDEVPVAFPLKVASPSTVREEAAVAFGAEHTKDPYLSSEN